MLFGGGRSLPPKKIIFFQKCSKIFEQIFQIYMKDAESTESKEKSNFRFFRFLFSELWSSFIKFWPLLSRGGRVCISLNVTGFWPPPKNWIFFFRNVRTFLNRIFFFQFFFCRSVQIYVKHPESAEYRMKNQISVFYFSS